MSLAGLKRGTRDIDVIAKDLRDHEILVGSLENCEYYQLQSQELSKPYYELSATALQNIEGFRWKIFIEYVAKN